MGVPEFNRITTISANQSKKVTILNLTITEDIAAGGTKNIFVYSPNGKISEVINMLVDFVAVAGATSGTQRIQFKNGGAITQLDILFAEAAFDKPVNFGFGEWRGTYTDLRPADKVAQVLILRGQMFDEENYFNIVYQNLTDAIQSGKKVIRLMVDELRIGE